MCVTPAVIAFFIGSYVGGIVGGDIPPYVWWVVTYIAFLVLNVFGVALSFRVTLIVTLASLAVLVVFWLSAIPNMDFSRWALNVGAEPATARRSNCPKATAPTSRSASRACSPPCPSRSGSSSPSSSCRSPPRNRSIPSATCRAASLPAC